jgi:hypothetical protein
MVVRGICISERMPSCIRAPPEAANRMNEQRFSTAFSIPVTTASPAAMPSDPAMKRKSCAAATISWPSSQPSPTRTASSSSVPALAVLSRSVYLRPSRNLSGSWAISRTGTFTYSPLSKRCWKRCCAVMRT